MGSVAAEYPELRATPPAVVKQQLVGVNLFLAAGIAAVASAAASVAAASVVAAAAVVVASAAAAATAAVVVAAAAAAEVAGSCKDSSLSSTSVVPWAPLPFAAMD